MDLKVGDTVAMTCGVSGHHYTGGLVTAITRTELFVRWPDLVIGIFQRKHAKHLTRETP